MSQPSLLITGVTGNIGGATLKHLDKSKFSTIKVGVTSQEKGKKFKEQGFEPVVLDLNSKESLTKAFQAIDIVFIVPPGSENRANQIKNAVEAAKEAGIKHVALFSVLNAHERRILFQKQFAEGEDALKKSGLKYTILQAPWFQDNVLGMKDGVYLPFRDGATVFCSVDDISRAAAAVLANPDKHDKKVYQLTGPSLATGEDIAKALSEALGKEVKYVNVSPEETKKTFLGFGMPEWQVDGILELLEDYAQRKYQVTDHIQQITGQKPKSIFEVAKQTLASQ